jgi:tellurite resistance protein TehA-like permease
VLPIVFLAAAAAICGGLAVVVLKERDLRRTGSAFMVTVSLQSLGGLAALESGVEHAPWLCYWALMLSAIGLALYPVVLRRFDLRQLLRGTGDQWIAGGALAISALTTGEISHSARQQTALSALGTPLAHVALAIWILSMLWLPALLVAELVAPRLAYHARRWSTLFPVGMYAASTFEVARTSGLDFAQAFATGWTWVAVALWLILAAGMARRSSRAARPAQFPG